MNYFKSFMLLSFLTMNVMSLAGDEPTAVRRGRRPKPSPSNQTPTENINVPELVSVPSAAPTAATDSAKPDASSDTDSSFKEVPSVSVSTENSDLEDSSYSSRPITPSNENESFQPIEKAPTSETVTPDHVPTASNSAQSLETTPAPRAESPIIVPAHKAGSSIVNQYGRDVINQFNTQNKAKLDSSSTLETDEQLVKAAGGGQTATGAGAGAGTPDSSKDSIESNDPILSRQIKGHEAAAAEEKQIEAGAGAGTDFRSGGRNRATRIYRNKDNTYVYIPKADDFGKITGFSEHQDSYDIHFSFNGQHYIKSHKKTDRPDIATFDQFETNVKDFFKGNLKTIENRLNEKYKTTAWDFENAEASDFSKTEEGFSKDGLLGFGRIVSDEAWNKAFSFVLKSSNFASEKTSNAKSALSAVIAKNNYGIAKHTAYDKLIKNSDSLPSRKFYGLLGICRYDGALLQAKNQHLYKSEFKHSDKDRNAIFNATTTSQVEDIVITAKQAFEKAAQQAAQKEADEKRAALEKEVATQKEADAQKAAAQKAAASQSMFSGWFSKK